MQTPDPQTTQSSRTRIVFDLRDILTALELAAFEANATAAGAKDLTEHFLNLTLQLGGKEAA